MRMPTALRNLDDRVLGNRGKKSEDAPYPDEPGTSEIERDKPVRGRESSGPPPNTSDGFREFLAVVARVSRLVFLALALIVGLGILFTVAPTNEDNVLVRFVLDVANAVAGPFRDIFTVDDNAERELVVNYGFAAGVYLLLSVLVPKLVPSKT